MEHIQGRAAEYEIEVLWYDKCNYLHFNYNFSNDMYPAGIHCFPQYEVNIRGEQEKIYVFGSGLCLSNHMDYRHYNSGLFNITIFNGIVCIVPNSDVPFTQSEFCLSQIFSDEICGFNSSDTDPFRECLSVWHRCKTGKPYQRGSFVCAARSKDGRADLYCSA